MEELFDYEGSNTTLPVDSNGVINIVYSRSFSDMTLEAPDDDVQLDLKKLKFSAAFGELDY